MPHSRVNTQTFVYFANIETVIFLYKSELTVLVLVSAYILSHYMVKASIIVIKSSLRYVFVKFTTEKITVESAPKLKNGIKEIQYLGII